MKKILLAVAAAGTAAVSLAALYGDTPDATHAWAVHDWHRPKPHRVTPADAPGGAPSDAVVLFDGTRASFEKNWRDAKGAPSQWSYSEDGYFYSVPGWKNGGSIFSRAEFGDCQLHLEYRHDPQQLYADKGPQMRGNSGVFLMNNYEIQVLESYHTSQEDCTVDNYTDGQAGAVYAENPPQVNPARAPGGWQVYDIVFHQPVWDGGKLRFPGSVTVFFNGVLVQDHWEMEGLTTHCKRRPLAPHPTVGPLMLQDHGCVVQFRNIWFRPLPSRYDNTTHGGPAANEADVRACRNKTAAALFAKIDTTKADAATVNALLEVIAYSADAPYLDAAKKACAAYRAQVEGMDDAAREAHKADLISLKKSYDVLWRNGLAQDCKLGALVNGIVAEKGWLKKK